jgi:hypothetical protein
VLDTDGVAELEERWWALMRGALSLEEWLDHADLWWLLADWYEHRRRRRLASNLLAAAVGARRIHLKHARPIFEALEGRPLHLVPVRIEELDRSYRATRKDGLWPPTS